MKGSAAGGLSRSPDILSGHGAWGEGRYATCARAECPGYGEGSPRPHEVVMPLSGPTVRPSPPVLPSPRPPILQAFPKKVLQSPSDPLHYAALFASRRSERSSVVEPHLAKVVVEGSNPFARSIFFWSRYQNGGGPPHSQCGGVAQLAEQLTLNQRVLGSNPGTSTSLRSQRSGERRLSRRRHSEPARNAKADMWPAPRITPAPPL
jgi:hypothetical protein